MIIKSCTSFLIISTICSLISCKKEEINLSCGPYVENNYIEEADTTSSLIFNESTINLRNCYSTSNNSYEIVSGNKYVFSYYFYFQEGPDDSLFEETLLFEVPSDVPNFYIEDFCGNKVLYSAIAAYSFRHLYEGPPGCISGEKFVIDGPEGSKIGYDVNINIPTYNEDQDSIYQYLQFSMKFYLSDGSSD